MSDPRDPVDSWLEADVDLLQPRPGTFERVSRRARRRKAIQATMTAAGAAVIIGGLVAAPNLASFLPGTKTSQSVSGVSASAGRHHRSAVVSRHASPVRPQHPVPAGRALPGNAAMPAPPGLVPESVTFIGPHTGAVLGTTKSANCRNRPCIAGTPDYGRHWFEVGAPPAARSEVGQIRFLNYSDGWAFGPGLWYTTDGGHSWARSALTAGHPNLQVTDVEALDGEAYALVGTCTRAQLPYGSECYSFSLYRSAAGTDDWHPVTGATHLPNPLGPQSASATASLVLAGGNSTDPAAAAGYLLSPSGAIVGGSLASASWSVLASRNTAAHCTSGVPAAAGKPYQELIASPGAGRLYLVCVSESAGTKTLSEWSAGSGWQLTGRLPGSGFPLSLAAQPGGQLVLASTSGIQVSADNGQTWALAQRSPAGSAANSSGFSYVGMTSPLLGVAIPEDPSLAEVFVTSDGGRSWHSSRL